jgi:hypothetical protein
VRRSLPAWIATAKPVGYYHQFMGLAEPVVVTIETRFAMSMYKVSCVLAFVVVILWPAATAAQGAAAASGAPPSVSDLQPSPVKRLLLDVQKQMRDGKHPRELIAQPIDDAVRAANRARGARAAGDKVHGAVLDKLATQWANTAKAVLRAVAAEQAATLVATRLREFSTKVKRAEALLTEQQARLGRLQEQVRKAEQRVQRSSNRAADGEARRLEAADKAAGKQPKERPKKPSPSEGHPAKPKGAR